MNSSLHNSLLSDDPLDSLDDASLFGRDHLVAQTIEVLGRVRRQSSSSTLGLIGAWGSGKTTVLNALAAQLRDPDDVARRALGGPWSVAEFNPWLYSDPASLHAGFFAELRAALPADERWSTTRKELADFGRRLTPLTGLTQVFGFNSKELYEGALAQLEPSTTSQRTTVEQRMAEASHPVLMVIDDLDRLSANELLHVFKLVRLVGRLPNVYYLLSYDELTIIDLLRKTDLVAAEDKRRALDYLEKIVQVRLDMPMLREHEVDTVVDHALDFVAQAHGLRVQNKSTLLQRFDSVMSNRLRTPRALKRMFGQLDAFLGAVGPEVRFDDFVILTWFRTIEPGVYGLMQSLKNELLGTGADALRRMSLPNQSNAQVRVKWLRRLEEAQVTETHQDDVLYLLTSLFPMLDGVYGGDDTEYSRQSRGTPEPVPGSISHPDYFDRFFAFGVPGDDIPDSVVHAAARELERGQPGTDTARLGQTFRTQPELVLRKLTQLSRSQPVAADPLIRWLSSRYEPAPVFGAVERRIEGLVAELLAGLPQAEGEALVRELSTTDSELYLMGSAQRILAAQQYGSQEDVARFNAAGAALAHVSAKLLQERIERLVAELESPLEAADEANRLKWLWWSLDGEGFRRLLEGAVHSGRWTLIDELAWFVECSVDADGQPYIGRFTGLSALPDLFDLQSVFTSLAPEIDAAERWDHSRDVLASQQALRRFVLASLKLLRDSDAN